MECLNPFHVKQKNQEPLPVPCGKCPSCTKRRISQWSFRLMNQERYSHDTHFITLTYNNDTVPVTNRGYLTLSKRDLQLFFKRLRKSNRTAIKYFAVGEYGSRTQRPHYHIILFNCSIESIQPAWTLEGRGIGDVHYGNVTGASVGYTLKYISKGRLSHDPDIDDRTPEFSLISKGLGAKYLTPQMVNWHLSDLENRMYVNLTDGRKIAMPRYYKNKIYDDGQRTIVGHATRIKMLEKHIEKTEQELWNFENAKVAAYLKMKLDSKKGDIL